MASQRAIQNLQVPTNGRGQARPTEALKELSSDSEHGVLAPEITDAGTITMEAAPFAQGTAENAPSREREAPFHRGPPLPFTGLKLRQSPLPLSGASLSQREAIRFQKICVSIDSEPFQTI